MEVYSIPMTSRGTSPGFLDMRCDAALQKSLYELPANRLVSPQPGKAHPLLDDATPRASISTLRGNDAARNGLIPRPVRGGFFALRVGMGTIAA